MINIFRKFFNSISNSVNAPMNIYYKIFFAMYVLFLYPAVTWYKMTEVLNYEFRSDSFIFILLALTAILDIIFPSVVCKVFSTIFKKNFTFKQHMKIITLPILIFASIRLVLSLCPVALVNTIGLFSINVCLLISVFVLLRKVFCYSALQAALPVMVLFICNFLS